MKPNVNEIRYHSEHSKMKTKTLLTALAMTSLLPVIVQAQVTVSSVTTNGLSEPYNVVLDSANNIYISDSANNRVVRIDASTQAASTFAGLPSQPPGFHDGFPYEALFNDPQGLLLVSGITNSVVTNSLINPVIGGLVTNLVVTTNGAVVTTNRVVRDVLNGLVV